MTDVAADFPVPPTERTAACEMCGQPQRLPDLRLTEEALCVRCGAPLVRDHPDGVNRTLAFAIAALIMYVPANVLPIMSFEYYGAAEKTTVLGGTRNLAESGMWFLAAIVFAASVVVPLLKLCGLFYLSLTLKTRRAQKTRTRVYRALRAVGTWAMLDVFLLAVLVAAVKLGQLATVTPGPAALPFSMVVVFTILATESFDPRLLWTHDRTADR